MHVGDCMMVSLIKLDGDVEIHHSVLCLWEAVVNAVSTPNTDTVSLSKCFVEGITAESLNDHYSQISTDSNYIPPALKQTVSIPNNDSVTGWRVFKVLDTLRSTASGLDGLPTWFLRVGAPIFCSPETHLFNLSLSTSTVPRLWKQAWIRPVPTSCSHSAFRLSANINYSISYQNLGKNGYKRLHLFSNSVTCRNISSDLIFHWEKSFVTPWAWLAASSPTEVIRTVLTQWNRHSVAYTYLFLSGGSTLGPGGHRPPKSCPGPPQIFSGLFRPNFSTCQSSAIETAAQ